MARLQQQKGTLFARVGLLIALVACSASGDAQGPQPTVLVQKTAFEVATLRPSRPGSTNEDWDSGDNRVTVRGYTLRKLIQAAFGMKSVSQVIGGPDWIDKQHFDMTAKIGDEEMARFKSSDRERQNGIQLMLQTLLAERFKLEVKPSKAELPYSDWSLVGRR